MGQPIPPLVGVYGMGEIGRKIAGRVAAFETEVDYFTTCPIKICRALEALAEWCSVLMIAVRAGADSSNAITLRNLMSVAHTIFEIFNRRISNLLYPR